jgi:hypothetical protein
MPFDYAAFRQTYIAKRHNRHEKRSRRATHNDSRKDINFRPLEYFAALRDYARSGRLTLTAQEKCVLYYDKRYLGRSDDPDMTSTNVTHDRLYWIAMRANCAPDEVADMLDMIEQVMWRASLLDIEVDTHYTITPRQKSKTPSIP